MTIQVGMFPEFSYLRLEIRLGQRMTARWILQSIGPRVCEVWVSLNPQRVKEPRVSEYWGITEQSLTLLLLSEQYHTVISTKCSCSEPTRLEQSIP